MSFIEGITKRRAVSLALFISLTSFLFPFSADDATAAGSGRALYNKATASYERLKNDRKKRRYRDQWERVIKGFDEVARRYPSSPYAGYALYYKAEASHSLYGVSRIRQDLDAALGAYREFVEKSPENEYVPEALNRAGGVALELGDAEGAATRSPRSTRTASTRRGRANGSRACLVSSRRSQPLACRDNQRLPGARGCATYATGRTTTTRGWS
jgi:tetratricopeptide (TPR) repeat protein